ncbi:AraC family transcriptional regulator [Pedobacter lusitanus]|uniref:AraC family transcriptional regulator n=1 Tax=Pedobacter lusitanus TaxID=1503925 RepID=A0A0D0GRS6_9SPHI|nr:response regulator transcription factor [Pedobacter lusitanus]KIO78905.1 AraC family transcriptional regulator [Pedobacter lusitanus]
MKYFTINPPEKLAAYVRFFWVLEGDATLESPYIHRSMADGCAELLFHYQGIFDELIPEKPEEKAFASGLAGQSLLIRRFVIRSNFGIFGAYLYPFAISQLFSIPGSELKNQMIDLKTLLGNQAHELEEKMMLAADHSQRVEIISGFLEKRLAVAKQQPPGIFQTIRYMIQTSEIINIEQLAAHNFLSTRQFERNFKQQAGFSPKLFSRIVRFQHALALYNHNNKSLAEIAYTCGYYDQSHFIQDFKQFSGHKPKEYFFNQAEGTAWRTV